MALEEQSYIEGTFAYRSVDLRLFLLQVLRRVDDRRCRKLAI